jgi:hypothetical protein
MLKKAVWINDTLSCWCLGLLASWYACISDYAQLHF